MRAQSVSAESPDLAVIGEVLAGKTESFAVLVKRYQNRVYSLGLKFFHNAEDARDFAQEVFIKAFERLCSFRGEAKFSTWLMKVAYYHGISVYRSSKKTESLADDYELPGRDDGPEKQHARNAATASLREALGLLPERYRICIDLYFSFGMTYEDISRVTDIPVGTIKSHVFRAKQFLRTALKNTCAEDYDYGL